MTVGSIGLAAHIPDDRLALSFGGSRSLAGITRQQVLRFADTGRLPVSPIWEIVRETVARTAEARHGLAAWDLLPSAIDTAIDRQIQDAARSTDR